MEEVKNMKYKLRESMSINKALDIFGLEFNPGGAELKALYKKLSLENHPDRGGSTEAMQNLNLAYEVLSKAPSQAKSDADLKKEYEEKLKRRFEYMKEMFESKFDPESYVEHLQKFVKDELIYTYVEPEFKYKSYSGPPRDFSPILKVYNKDNTVSFDIYWYITYNEPPSNGLSSSDIDEDELIYNVSYTTKILFNKRSQKLTNKNWNWGAGTKSIGKPSEMFPDARMIKITTDGKKSFKKSDFLLGLSKQVEMTLDGTRMFIYPFGKNVKFYFLLDRSVMLKTPTYRFWNWQFINSDTMKYAAGRHPVTENYLYLEETEETLDKVIEFIDDLRAYKDRTGIDPNNGGEDIAKFGAKNFDKVFKDEIEAYEKWKVQK